jgi:2-amino-1-hydroxyethylphosphonate dioxygenase (glycine-forming)
MPPNVLVGVEQCAQETIQTLFAYIQGQGPRDYGGHDGGECVSQLEHSLQAGYLAKKAGADDETVLAALLHDIGHFIPMYAEMPMLIAPNGSRVGRKSHDLFGETYLRELGSVTRFASWSGRMLWQSGISLLSIRPTTTH